jgi:hypothetical protein
MEMIIVYPLDGHDCKELAGIKIPVDRGGRDHPVVLVLGEESEDDEDDMDRED